MPPSPAFKLRIFKSEYEEIKNLVLRFENIETGGDLFGLWTREAQPVIQLIIGPGQDCNRTSVSFHQDINYLQNIGGFLNTSFMLCHIGSWHSHHQLSLTHPSTGDHTTVRNNFPASLERYIMVIANIVSSATASGTKDVKLHPYMFSCKGEVCEDGAVELIHSSSPFREVPRVANKIVTGAERTQENSNSPRRQHPTGKSRLQNRPSCRPGHGTRASSQNYEKSPTNATSKKPHEGPEEKANDDQWYDSPTGREELKKIHEGILEMIKAEHARGNQNDKDKVKFNRDSKSHELTLEFLHQGRQWSIQFPKSFDEEKARVFYSRQNSLKSSRSELSLPLSLSLSNNVIESIQCWCACPSCRLLMNLRTDEVKNDHRAEVMETDTEQSYEESMSVCNDEESEPRSFTSMKNGTIKQESRTGGNNSDTGEYQELASMTSSDSNLAQWHDTATEDGTIDNQAVRIEEENKDRTKVGHQNLTSTSYDADAEQYSSSESNYDTFQDSKISQNSQNMADIYNTQGVNQSGGALHQRSLRTHGGADTSDSERRIERRIQQWYESDQGAEKLRIICEQIASVLKPTSEVEITRDRESLDLSLSFRHNHYEWTIKFPRSYDDEDATIEYTTEDFKNHHHHASKDIPIVKAVQGLCPCEDCGVENNAKEIANYSQQGLDDNIEKTTTEFKPSPHNRDSENHPVSLNISQVESKESEVSSSSSISPGKKTRKSAQKRPRRRKITFPEHANKSRNEKLSKNEERTDIKLKAKLSHRGGRESKSTSFNTSPAESQELDISSSSASSGGKMRKNLQERPSPYRCRNSMAEKTTKGHSGHSSQNENLLETSGGKKRSWITNRQIPISGQCSNSPDLMLNELQKYIKVDTTKASVSVPGEFKFKHYNYDWTILFHETIPARLFKTFCGSRSFCGLISSPNNVVEILKNNCECCKCKPPKSKSRAGPYPVVSGRKLAKAD